MTPELAYLARIFALRQRFSELRTELAATTDDETSTLVFEEAVATLRRIKELEAGQ